ncbi:hypothetical protein BGZ80_008676 [Entomortierella chlamydospora]|uniref:Uncharacterized protein n=1 Tax=Entomortierella chlamydospora TaxID=101097 RepID=A0A9P6T0X7_9FUNG|nr:hypothetical protein BGZ80_008676 [Entomortierella chlamydospora]
MSDSTPQANGNSNSNSTNTGVTTNAETTKSSTTQGNASKKTAAKLNPDAKDYVPRTTTSGSVGPSAGTSSTSNPRANGSNNNPRNRRRRNPDTNKSRDADNQVNRSSETGNNSNNNNNNNNRNRRNRGRTPKQVIGGGARIDDDDDEDDIEINMDRPVEPSESQAAVAVPGAVLESTSTAQGSKNAATKDRRRGGRRKGKEVSDPSIPKLQQDRGGKGRSRAIGTDGQPESSTSSSSRAPRASNSNNSGNNDRGDSNNNNRRQRNRKAGDLGGRIFSTASQGSTNQAGESSGPQRNAQKKTPRNQPKKFVHTVEEDRDLMAALTAGLSDSTYDCMVCWDVIRPAHKIWNCQVCWAAFHLDCLSTWAKKSSEDILHLILVESFVDVQGNALTHAIYSLPAVIMNVPRPVTQWMTSQGSVPLDLKSSRLVHVDPRQLRHCSWAKLVLLA